MAELYKRFAKDYPQADFSKQAAEDMYTHETYGIPMPVKAQLNGYMQGKKLMDITISMWKEDIKNGVLSIKELKEDNYPEWFLKRTKLL